MGEDQTRPSGHNSADESVPPEDSQLFQTAAAAADALEKGQPDPAPTENVDEVETTEVPKTIPEADRNGDMRDTATQELPRQEAAAEPAQPPPAEAAAASQPTADPSRTQEYLEGWQRTRAEFANYKKRTERELSESKQRGALDAITRVLPVIDDFERAMENVPADLKDHPWFSGTALLLRKFEKLLADYDVQVLSPNGEAFDPSRHEAIGMEESSEVESGHVTVTLQKGYIAGDRVLRPALVRVAS